MTRRPNRILPALFTLLAALAVVAGCAGAATPAPSAATPVVSDAWYRPPTAAGGPGAIYLTITNPGGTADALVAASTSIAMTCELHQSTTESGMTGMHPVGRLEIPAGGTVKLEPGGYHLMLMGVDDLIAGSTFDIKLEFEHAGVVTVAIQAPQG